MIVDLDTQIACVERDIAMRRRVYDMRLAEGTIKRETVEKELSEMRAVLATLHDYKAMKERVDAAALQVLDAADMDLLRRVVQEGGCMDALRQTLVQFAAYRRRASEGEHELRRLRARYLRETGDPARALNEGPEDAPDH